MLEIFLAAVALMLVLEGVLPFLLPTLWRETFQRLITLSDGQIRFLGLTSLVLGLSLMLLLNLTD